MKIDITQHVNKYPNMFWAPLCVVTGILMSSKRIGYRTKRIELLRNFLR